ncbi:MAG: type II secretion system protein GspE, partial [Clostridia bacterium]|nr:type II secretion system protein GspE [Clostridia bacterium]
MDGRIGRQKLGEVLIRNGIITIEQLEMAISFVKENTEKMMLLGEALVELGYCSEKDIARTMAHRSKVKFLSRDDVKINMQASNLISPELADRYSALPIDFTEDNEKLIVAMQNPTDLMTIDDLSLITGYEIVPVVMEDSQLHAAIEHFAYMSTGNMTSYEEEEAEALDTEEEEDSTLARPAVQLVNQMLNQA